jgi:hypothetical protein
VAVLLEVTRNESRHISSCIFDFRCDVGRWWHVFSLFCSQENGNFVFLFDLLETVVRCRMEEMIVDGECYIVLAQLWIRESLER